MCVKVQRLAVKNFHQSSVAAACVAFLELLGQDSSALRVCVQVASLILSHKSSLLQGAIEQRRQTEAKLQVELGECASTEPRHKVNQKRKTCLKFKEIRSKEQSHECTTCVFLGDLMVCCLRKRKRHCADVLSMLEKAIIWQLDKYRVRVYVCHSCPASDVFVQSL